MNRQLVILADSYRDGERCIAGIDVQTGQWVRPVSNLPKKLVTFDMRNIDGREPELLDIVQMPLENTGPDEGCQPENRLLKSGRWHKVGALSVEQVKKYCENTETLLHNDDDHIDAAYFEGIPKDQWKSLQLIKSTNILFYPTIKLSGRKGWRALFQYGQDKTIDLVVTDPRAIQRLNDGARIGDDCLLTISLTAPWIRDNTPSRDCYKLVAGVIEL